MAKETSHTTDDIQMVETRFFDEQGRLVLEFHAGETAAFDPDGTMIVRKCYQSINLVCGCQYHPGQAEQELAVCSLCREPPYEFPRRQPPRHGLMCSSHTQTCTSCRLSLCPRHTRTYKGKPYCPSCCRQAKRRRVINWILFEKS